MAAKRNAGVLVHRLQWSMSHGRPIRAVLADRKQKTGRVVRCCIDKRREAALMKLPPAERTKAKDRSTIVAVFEDGTELAVDSIARVQLPLGETGAAFGDDDS